MRRRESIAILGAGAWGTALSKVLAEQGHDITLWCNESEVAKSIREKRENTKYLPSIILPDSIKTSTDLLDAMVDKKVVFLVTPSQYLIGIVKKMVLSPNILDGKCLVVVGTKGFISGPHGSNLILDAIESYLPGFYRSNTVYLSGPSHAEEVSRGMITGLVSASRNGRNAIMVRELFKGGQLLVFPSFDVVGVQVCAATKNVVAIAFGIMDAISESSVVTKQNNTYAFGGNSESLLLAAGLNEMQALGRAMGATHTETFTNIAGVGDLDVTCRSNYGRNRRFGREIVNKNILKNFKDANDLLARIKEIGYLPEGAFASVHVQAIAKEKKITLPIMQGIYDILNRKIEPLEFFYYYIKSLANKRLDKYCIE